MNSAEPEEQTKKKPRKILTFSWEAIRDAIFLLAIFVGIALWRFFATGQYAYLIIFGYIGVAGAIGAFLSKALVRKHKLWGRRISQILIGLFMLGLLGLLGHENMQIEGFFFYLIAGVFAGATLHYFIAKLIGPVFFGRAWCAWACWTMMLMDLFPWKRPSRGRIKYLGLLRYLHFVLVTGTVLYLWLVVDYGPAEHSAAELKWLIVGNVGYYVLAIVLAAILKDNRAFCKYICPIPVPMKILSRFSLIKQQIDMEKCNDCGLCEKRCLMDIKLLEYARNNQRVLSTECILCDTCANICPTDAIESTSRFDFGWRERVRMGPAEPETVEE